MTGPPNVIVVLTDDQGYGDLSCMGSDTVRTPHLDRLAARGVRFTNWYANAPVCSPTRASLLTGRYPRNTGVRSILRGHRTATGLPSRVPTIARILKDRGYRTAIFGKWHLGLAPGCRPEDHGFDASFGHLAGCIDYYSHIFYWDRSIDPVHDLWENGHEIWENGSYMTDLITDRAVRYVRNAHRDGAPFFVYLAYNAPHYPMHAPDRYLERFPHLPSDRRTMAAMLSAVDDGIGAVCDELARQGSLDNTLITFQSDNGPSRETRNWLDGREDPYYGGSSGGLKGHKSSLFDGGIRVPGIITWPESIRGGRVLDTPGAAIDILPTILAACGGRPQDYEVDGINLLPHIADNEPPPERDIFFQFEEQAAVRRGRWKLVRNGRLVENGDVVAPLHLSDLAVDPGESVNLAAQYPDLVSELERSLDDWSRRLEDRWRHEFDQPGSRPVTHQ